jgi:glutaredoxin 3
LEYIDVLSDPDKLSSMMKYSNGMRKVPIIVEGDKVSIGFNGRS